MTTGSCGSGRNLYGRRTWSRPHLFDLADGTRQTVPWDESLDVGVVLVEPLIT